jgi:hypothetical protein
MPAMSLFFGALVNTFSPTTSGDELVSQVK